MKQLVDAVIERYQADVPECAALREVCRAFYPYRTPQHPDWPCVTVDIDTPTTSQHVMQATGSTSLYEEGQLKLTIFAADDTMDGATRVNQVYELLVPAFDNVVLDMPDYRTVMILRRGQHLMSDPDGGWIYHVLYDFIIGRR